MKTPDPDALPPDATLDELFSEGGRGSAPRLALPLALVGVGVVAGVVGMVCTAAPGGLLVLAGWLLLEQQQRRVDAGALPEGSRAAIQGALRVTYAAVFLVVILFVVQLLLYCSGYYEVLWGTIFGSLRFLLGG